MTPSGAVPRRGPRPPRYCPHDRARLHGVPGEAVRVRACPRCDFVDYGNPAPCAEILLVRRGRVLLCRRAVPPHRGWWDIPGGFIEPGESAEAAVRREAREELGVRVRVRRYLGSVPDVYGPRGRPILNLAYEVELVAGAPAAASDVAAIGWFPLGRLPPRLAFPHQRDVLGWLRAARRSGRRPGSGPPR